MYFILFGRLSLVVPGGSETLNLFGQKKKLQQQDLDTISQKPNALLGRINIGWSIGEEILFEYDK